MKKTLLTLTLCLSSLTLTAAYAASDLTSCAAKKQDIETRLAFARQHNNTQQVAGLEKALREVDQNCTEGSLLKERQEKVAEKKREVLEREQELAKAKAEGRSASKIQKREDKLAEAREELKDAEQALHQ
ncbi:DUF1090 domain-containing protein [Pantoea sp. GD03673]|uniref:DUF1090 domain-containing protein n=1 Tax=Pantoea sp. GD03673 TaxID=2975364 RepID=UPI00244D4078|nr:DUF1090 domain-containing protein [Pantoea sp. GD03673]MDH2066940.1 DUF1090 domain-containing protein [Pantoea sp. GD03673]